MRGYTKVDMALIVALLAVLVSALPAAADDVLTVLPSSPTDVDLGRGYSIAPCVELDCKGECFCVRDSSGAVVQFLPESGPSSFPHARKSQEGYNEWVQSAESVPGVVFTTGFPRGWLESGGSPELELPLKIEPNGRLDSQTLSIPMYRGAWFALSLWSDLLEDCRKVTYADEQMPRCRQRLRGEPRVPLPAALQGREKLIRESLAKLVEYSEFVEALRPGGRSLSEPEKDLLELSDIPEGRLSILAKLLEEIEDLQVEASIAQQDYRARRPGVLLGEE